jgi:glycosyltransferase involved in cell wall biosynthesis
MNSVRVTMIDGLVGNDYSIYLCSALHAVGVDVELIAPDNRVVSIPVDFPIRHWMPTKEPTSGKFRKLFHYFEYLARLLIHVVSNKRKRVAHVQFLRSERVESIFLLLLRLLGTRLVFTAHNVLPHENSAIDCVLRSGIYRAAGRIIAHSDYIKNKLAKDFGVDRAKVRVIPHGNFDHYLPIEPMSKVEARVSLNLPERENVALFFGYIREYKGLDLLLDAFEICTRKGYPFRLVIAGALQSLELGDHYRRRIDQLSTDHSITFHADFIPSERVATYFVASDVVILPYKEIDHSGLVHLAYSFGRPLIATNVGDFSEVIEDGRSGFLLKENSAECLAETILGAFSNSTRLENMGDYARQLSETRYSWIDIARRTKGLYEALS